MADDRTENTEKILSEMMEGQINMPAPEKDASNESVHRQLLRYAKDMAALYQNLKRENEKLLRANQELEESYYETVLMGFDIMNLNDEFLGGHCKRVSYYAESLAHEMNLDEKMVMDVKLAAIFHDAGLMGIPFEDLKEMFRDGPKSELPIYRNHPLVSIRPITSNPRFRNIVKIISCHHERPDGSGFPKGLRGKYIPLESRIIATADAYDIFRTFFPEKMETGHILHRMSSQAGALYDAEVFEVFHYMIEHYDPFLQITDIYADELCPGMMLAEPIETKSGIRLLSSDTILREDHIEHIRQRFNVWELKLPMRIYRNKKEQTL